MKTVLVVDDDTEILDMVRVVLEEKNLHVCTAKDGKACMRDIIVKKPDLIIMDLKMPNMDGLNALDLIRVTQMNRQVPIIIWSGDSDPDVISRAERLGADDFLSKSTPMPEFTKIVELFLYAPETAEVIELLKKAPPVKTTGPLPGGLNPLEFKGWECFPVTVRDLELCLLIKEGVTADAAQAMSATVMSENVQVMQKMPKRWRKCYP